MKTIHNSLTLQDWTRYLFPAELTELKRLALLLPKNPTVVNFGAGNGTSAFCFLEAREDLKLITIDIQSEPSPFGCLAAERQHLEGAGYWDTRDIEHIHGDSAVIASQWKKPMKRKKVDLVFVDGGHVAPQPELDILGWLKNIKRGGIMAVHDYQKGDVFKTPQPDNVPHPKPWGDVDEAVEALLIPKYKKLRLVDSLISFRIR